MIHQLNDTPTSDAGTARYVLAQYVADPLRMESRNVGVFVEKAGLVTSRFFGETGRGKWDIAKLRRLGNANAFRLWVDHWRKKAESPGSSLDALPTDKGANYCIVPGGEVRSTGSDSPEEVCDYLFGALVASEGLASVFEDEAGETPTVLQNDLLVEFRKLQILASFSHIRHPIYHNRDVRGKARWHGVTFYQESREVAWAIEPIDFSQKRKIAALHRAAYVRYVFSDLLEANKSAEKRLPILTVAVVRVNQADVQDEVAEGFEILNGVCDVVDWSVREERKSFLDRTEAIARAA